MRPGQTDGRGRTYYRCTFCGDSNDRSHAHAFYDRDGRTYCFRCGTSGTLPMERLVDVALGEVSVDEVLDSWEQPDLRRAPSERRTLLSAFEGPSFPMYTVGGRMCGWHDRSSGKGLNSGRRGFNWVGASDGVPLLSDPDVPLVLVEGPFDVVRPHHVTCFGLITASVLERMRLHHLWVWPDPDQLGTEEQRERVVDMLSSADRDHCFVHGLIVSNADPDEETCKAYVPVGELRRWLRVGSRGWLRS